MTDVSMDSGCTAVAVCQRRLATEGSRPRSAREARSDGAGFVGITRFSNSKRALAIQCTTLLGEELAAVLFGQAAGAYGAIGLIGTVGHFGGEDS